MKPLLFKISIPVLLLAIFSSYAQLINKKEFRLKDSKPGIIELSNPVVTINKISTAKNKSLLLAGSLLFITLINLNQYYFSFLVNI